jgi:hypothetical protein
MGSGQTTKFILFKMGRETTPSRDFAQFEKKMYALSCMFLEAAR